MKFNLRNHVCVEICCARVCVDSALLCSTQPNSTAVVANAAIGLQMGARLVRAAHVPVIWIRDLGSAQLARRPTLSSSVENQLLCWLCECVC